MVDPSAQAVDVIAMYGGDATHLPSRSSLVHITFSPLDFCCTPGAATVAAGTASPTRPGRGRARPLAHRLRLHVRPNGTGCSTLNEHTGAFVAGTGRPDT